MTYPHPPRARGEAGLPVSIHPPREGLLVLRLEGPQARHCLGRRHSIPRRRELRVEAPEHFVARGSLGVWEFQDAPGAHKRPARALGLAPRLVLLVPHALGNARSGELGAVVELRAPLASPSRSSSSSGHSELLGSK